MDIGMLWYAGKGSLEDQVTRAVAFYKQNHGKITTLCIVNPGVLSEAKLKPGAFLHGVELRSARTVLDTHVWVGHTQ